MYGFVCLLKFLFLFTHKCNKSIKWCTSIRVWTKPQCWPSIGLWMCFCVWEIVRVCVVIFRPSFFFCSACEIWPNYKYIFKVAMWFFFLSKSIRNPPEQLFIEHFSGWIDTNTFCGIIFARELILFYNVIFQSII